MKKQIYKMMPEGIQPEKLTIQHMTERRQRMPHVEVRLSKSPNDTFHAYTFTHVWVVNYVLVVVVVDELIVAHRPIYTEGC